MQIPSLLSDIASLIKNERTDVAVRLAVITSYVPGDLFAGLRIGGSTSEVRGRFINYDPVVGETVQVIQDGLDPIIIGKVGSTGPGLAVPIGLVAMWGNSVPTDWERCEGQSTAGRQALALVWGDNVPDLRYMFVRGAGTGMPVGARGGTEQLVLNWNQMPQHGHEVANHQHGMGIKRSGDEDPNFGLAPGSTGFAGRVMVDSGDYLTAHVGGATGNAGSSSPIDITPPFYAVTYIVKVA